MLNINELNNAYVSNGGIIEINDILYNIQKPYGGKSYGEQVVLTADGEKSLHLLDVSWQGEISKEIKTEKQESSWDFLKHTDIKFLSI